MTFALPGVEEHEADSDGVCEQLSHLLQATGYVAALSKLTVCNTLPPSCPPFCLLFQLPFLSSLCHPPLFFHASSRATFFWPSDCLSYILSDQFCFILSQPTAAFIFRPPSALGSFFAVCVCLRGEQVGGCKGPRV